MYILISSLVSDALDVVAGEDLELLSDIDDRERQIDARRLLLKGKSQRVYRCLLLNEDSL